MDASCRNLRTSVNVDVVEHEQAVLRVRHECRCPLITAGMPVSGSSEGSGRSNDRIRATGHQ